MGKVCQSCRTNPSVGASGSWLLNERDGEKWHNASIRAENCTKKRGGYDQNEKKEKESEWEQTMCDLGDDQKSFKEGLRDDDRFTGRVREVVIPWSHRVV